MKWPAVPNPYEIEDKENAGIVDNILYANPERPYDYIFSAPSLKKRQKWENDYVNIYGINEREYHEGLRYRYKTFNEIPAHHYAVCQLLVRHRSVETIAHLSGFSIKMILNIAAHPPNAAWIEGIKERWRLKREEAAGAKDKLAEEAFERLGRIVRREEKADLVQLKATLHAMSLDPHGRYEPYSKQEEGTEPIHGSSLLEYIEKGSVNRFNATTVQATPTGDTDAKAPAAIEADANCQTGARQHACEAVD